MDNTLKPSDLVNDEILELQLSGYTDTRLLLALWKVMKQMSLIEICEELKNKAI